MCGLPSAFTLSPGRNISTSSCSWATVSSEQKQYRLNLERNAGSGWELCHSVTAPELVWRRKSSQLVSSPSGFRIKTHSTRAERFRLGVTCVRLDTQLDPRTWSSSRDAPLASSDQRLTAANHRAVGLRNLCSPQKSISRKHQHFLHQ